jgi:hypothetical protein
MEGHGTISEKCLYFCYEKIALFEESSHLELIALQFPTLKSARTQRGQQTRR